MADRLSKLLKQSTNVQKAPYQGTRPEVGTDEATQAIQKAVAAKKKT